MRKHVLLYGVLAGVLGTALQLMQYRWLIITHSAEIYATLVAVLFATLGIWLGGRLRTPRVTRVEVVKEIPVPVEVPVEMPVEVRVPAEPFVRDAAQVAALGLTPRELEILEFIAAGLSTREIAERAYVSENTVKTHAGRVYEKLGVQRRTQAAQRARELRLIP